MDIGLLVAVIALALGFTYINGFHDTANSIATVVATKVLTRADPRPSSRPSSNS